MEDLIEAYLSVYEENDIDEGFKRMNRDKIEKQAKRLGGDRGDVLRIVADKMDTEAERKYSTSQARKNRAGAGSEYRKAQELRARDDAKADFKKYGLPESADLYDLVLDHLLDEGYAETEENAITIMANMSEEWIDEIIDEAREEEGKSEYEKRGIRNKRFIAITPGMEGESPSTVGYLRRQQKHVKSRGKKKR